jgi:hypothetical protein
MLARAAYNAGNVFLKQTQMAIINKDGTRRHNTSINDGPRYVRDKIKELGLANITEATFQSRYLVEASASCVRDLLPATTSRKSSAILDAGRAKDPWQPWRAANGL